MIFKIYRTSSRAFREYSPPCKNAEVGEEEYKDIERIFSEKAKLMFQVTTKKRKIWTIKIDSLEDLIALRDEIRGEEEDTGLILLRSEEGVDEIEIYDSYRE